MSSDLLLDFSSETSSTTPAQNGTSQASDPFDPFAPIGGNTEHQQTDGATDSFDPFSTKSSDTNPLYEAQHAADADANPLYELSKNGHDDEGDYQELQESSRDDYRDYAELVDADDQSSPREVERTEETYTEEDGTVVTVTTITKVDADGNTITEIMESRMTEEGESGDEEEVVMETHEEVIQEDDEQEEQRRHSVSSEEGGEPYGKGVTIETVVTETQEEVAEQQEEQRRQSVSSDEGGEPYGSGVTIETVVTETQQEVEEQQEEERRKSVSSSDGEGEPYGQGVTMETVHKETEQEKEEEGGEPYSSGVTMECLQNEPLQEEKKSEYEDGQEYTGPEQEEKQPTEKRGVLADLALDQYEEYIPPKRVEKTEDTKKDVGPQYTIMGMPSATTYTRKTSTETKTASQDRPKDVASGDDKVDDGLDNCSSLGSLKSRFEAQKQQEAAVAAVERKAPRVRPARAKPAQEEPAEDTPSPVIEEESEVPRDPNVARESKEKEEVHFAELASVKSRFEQQARQAASVPSPSRSTPRTRKSLTPDDTKPAPPVVNRTEEDQVADLPAAGTSRNLLAKFKSMESGEVPKPVAEPRKMTPPREQPRAVSEDRESESSDAERVRAADKKGEVVEEELPTPGSARTLFAKFKSMENTTYTPPTPERKPPPERKFRYGYGYQADVPKKNVDDADSAQRVSPERLQSGEFESTPEVRPDVAREHDDAYEMNPEGGEFENTPVVRADLVREEDRHDEEELPEEGMAKNLLAKFKSLQSTASQQKEYKPSGIGNKATPTPLRPAVRMSSRDDVSMTSDGDSMADSQHSLGGEYESTPQVRTDVLREADHLNEEEELPEEGMAKNLLAKFKSIESSSPQIALLPTTPKRQSTTRKTASTHSVDADSGIYESDTAPRTHHEPKVEGGEFESTPEHRGDVTREEDYNDEEELPEEGTTKNLLARFKAMQAN